MLNSWMEYLMLGAAVPLPQAETETARLEGSYRVVSLWYCVVKRSLGYSQKYIFVRISTLLLIYNGKSKDKRHSQTNKKIRYS